MPTVPETTTPIELTELASVMRSVSMRAGRRAAATTTIAEALSPQPPGAGVTSAWATTSAEAGPGPSGLVDQLERLARLHDTGALGELEYMEAKQAVIAAASHGERA